MDTVVSDSYHKRSPAVNQERLRPVGDFPSWGHCFEFPSLCYPAHALALWGR